jgi:hypothetical protein
MREWDLEETKMVCVNLGGKSNRKKPLRRPRHTHYNDIKICYSEPGNEYRCKSRIMGNMMLEVLEDDIGLLLKHNSTKSRVSFQDTAECDNVLLPLRSPEYPFGEASSSPLDPVVCGDDSQVSQLPCFKRNEFNAWSNDYCTKLKGGTVQNM